MAVYTLPLTNTPQKLTVSLNGTVYNLKVVWNKYAGWIMDVSDVNNNPILQGVPLVTGADLLAQYGYKGIADGSGLIVQSDADPLAPPSYSTLGVTAQVYLVTPS